jgi:hypothetical protein
MRQVATLAAIILLLGQTIAAAHFHPVSSQREFSAGGTAGIADGSCAICSAQLHSSFATAVAPALNASTVQQNLVALMVPSGPPLVYIGPCFGRAPPALF